MDLEFAVFDDKMSEKLMDAYRLYSEKYYNGLRSNPWIIYGIADRKREFCFARCNIASNAAEYIFFYGELLGLAKCGIKVNSKAANGNWQYLVEELEIKEIKGNAGLGEIKLEEIIRFYEETNFFEFEQRLCEKLGIKSHLLSSINIVKQHEIMMKSAHKWENSGDLLAKDYIFEPISDEEKIRFEDCAEKYGKDYKYFQHLRLDLCMTDKKRSFKMTLCSYVSDFIKRMDEPDDYEFAIITPQTSGTALVWICCNDVKIQNIGGEIPISKDRLDEIVCFYNEFYYHFARLL